MIKYAVIVELPEGKMPGFYAQFVKALANQVRLFDRDKEMLIVDSQEERKRVVEVMKRFKFAYDFLDLRLLPHEVRRYPAFDDYGFISRAENAYVYEHLTAVYRINEDRPASPDLWQALLQMEEHWIASCAGDGGTRYVVDAQLRPLIERIAEAYRCQVEWLE